MQGLRRLDSWVDAHMTAWNVNDVIHSLVMDGIFNGVGSVLSFLPIIVTLFFFLSLSGGQRIYGAGCVCDGQAAAQNRSFRQKHCADAGWVWMYRAGRYGESDTAL